MLFIELFITFCSLPYKAYVSAKSNSNNFIQNFSEQKHKLEWMTSEEAEKVLKDDIASYYKLMYFNTILGFITLVYFLY